MSTLLVSWTWRTVGLDWQNPDKNALAKSLREKGKSRHAGRLSRETKYMSIGRLQRSLSNGGWKISSLMMYQLYNTIHKIFLSHILRTISLALLLRMYATGITGSSMLSVSSCCHRLWRLALSERYRLLKSKAIKRQAATESGHVEAAMVDDVTFPMLPEAAKVSTRFEIVAK